MMPAQAQVAAAPGTPALPSWFNGTSFQAWQNPAFDNAIFGGTPGNVTLGTPIAVHNITYNSSGYILNGSTLTLGGATSHHYR